MSEGVFEALAFAGAEDVTQRRGNPYLTRTSYTSAQCLYPLGDYVAKDMKLKTAARTCRTISRKLPLTPNCAATNVNPHASPQPL